MSGNEVALGLSLEAHVRYLVAWILGVPTGVIALWYIVSHSGC